MSSASEIAEAVPPAGPWLAEQPQPPETPPVFSPDPLPPPLAPPTPLVPPTPLLLPVLPAV